MTGWSSDIDLGESIASVGVKVTSYLSKNMLGEITVSSLFVATKGVDLETTPSVPAAKVVPSLSEHPSTAIGNDFTSHESVLIY